MDVHTLRKPQCSFGLRKVTLITWLFSPGWTQTGSSLTQTDHRPPDWTAQTKSYSATGPHLTQGEGEGNFLKLNLPPVAWWGLFESKSSRQKKSIPIFSCNSNSSIVQFTEQPLVVSYHLQKYIFHIPYDWLYVQSINNFLYTRIQRKIVWIWKVSKEKFLLSEINFSTQS